MNQPTSLDRMVAQWMADTAPQGSADQLVDQIISATARQRPRSRWLALLQEPPMQTQSRVLVGSPNGRLVIVATLLLIAALAAVGIGAFLLQQPKPSATDDWPGFRGDASHAGVVAHGPIGNPKVAWRMTLGGPVRNDVAILGDLAFVGSDDGLLSAFHVADGTRQWSFSAPAPMGGPHAIDGVVYAVDGDGVVHATKAADGTEIWASTVKIPNAGDGVVSEGLLYYASPDGAVIALRVQDGSQAWRTVVSPTPIGMRPGQFSETGGIVVDEDGSVVVIDNVRAVIETYKPDGTVISTIPAFPEELHAVTGINRGANQIHIGPNGHYFLSLVEPTVVAELDRQGKLVRTYGGHGDPCALSEQPGGIDWDAAGRMYLAQGPSRGDRPGVLVFEPDGSCLGGFGKPGDGQGELAFPWSVLVDESGIYVSDAGVSDIGLRSAIRKFEPLPPM
jgi:outer membrane protein assembly factor BamB